MSPAKYPRYFNKAKGGGWLCREGRWEGGLLAVSPFLQNRAARIIIMCANYDSNIDELY